MSKLFDAQDGDYVQLPWGTLVFHNNELHIVTDVGDAAGLSFRGATNSKISWKDAGGSEKVLLILRENAKGQGEFYFGCFSPQRHTEMLAKGGAWAEKALDLAMIELATLNPDGLEIRVPVKFSAGIAGGSGGGQPMSEGNYDGAEMMGSEGKFLFVRQTDGHDVLYKIVNGQRTAIWASDGGENGTWLNP